MNIKITMTAVLLGALFAATPAFAQGLRADLGAGAEARVGSTTVRASTQARLEARITKGKARAQEEIQRRIKRLNELGARTQEMLRVSAEEKTSIAAQVSAQVSALTALGAKIEADADIDTLKADIKSVTKSYRIFALVIPQGHILVAADKIKTTADVFLAFVAKLETRIAQAQAAGKDTARFSATLADAKADIADAKVQAEAAVALVANLSPDNGDKTAMEANETAIHSARAKIQAGYDDLKRARKGAGDIVQGLKGLKDFGASASSTTSGSASTQ